VKKSALGFIFGLIFALLLTSLVGESPWHVFSVLFHSSFGSLYDLGLTLFYCTSLIFTGLAVCIPFHAGLFNIGAEGQLTIGAFTMAAIGIALPAIPFPWAYLLALGGGALAAGLWGFIPGWLKARRGSHEVIVTMMFNFIAAGLTSYFVVGVFKNTESQNPETAMVGAGYQLKSWDFLRSLSPDSPLNISLLFALVLAVLVWIFLYKTIWGFELRAVGQNEEAASLAGVRIRKYKVLSMFLGGAIAGLVGLNEILGSAGKFRLGFSADYGFVGIAVALLARNNPLGIILSAFLFGALQKGASDLDLETAHVTRDFAKILQAIIILSVAGFYFLNFSKLKKWVKKWIWKN
jgi:simple sugar transport system permease protein